MKLIKRVCIFLMMFWSVGFLLTLAVQFFAHDLFEINFRKIESAESITLEAGGRLNLYIAALDKMPDVAQLSPQVTVLGTDEQALKVEPFDFKLTRPGEDGEPIYAHALYSVSTTQPQAITVDWGNPQPGYFLTASDSLMRSSVAFFTLIFLSLLGAALLYAAFGKKVLQRLTITPQAES